jgi:hypothetical protein
LPHLGCVSQTHHDRGSRLYTVTLTCANNLMVTNYSCRISNSVLSFGPRVEADAGSGVAERAPSCRCDSAALSRRGRRIRPAPGAIADTGILAVSAAPAGING